MVYLELRLSCYSFLILRYSEACTGSRISTYKYSQNFWIANTFRVRYRNQQQIDGFWSYFTRNTSCTKFSLHFFHNHTEGLLYYRNGCVHVTKRFSGQRPVNFTWNFIKSNIFTLILKSGYFSFPVKLCPDTGNTTAGRDCPANLGLMGVPVAHHWLDFWSHTFPYMVHVI